MKQIALILCWLVKMCNFLPYRYSCYPIGILGAFLVGMKAELTITGDHETVKVIDDMGEEIEKNRWVANARRATAVNPSEEVK